MRRYSAFLESSRPTPIARAALTLADAYVSLRYPGQCWPPRGLMYEGTRSRWVYRRNGVAYLEYLESLANLTPASRLFDIGSGLGRKTWPLIDYFVHGTYLGVEPRQEAAEWCQNNLTTRDKKLQFQHLDVRNGYYTPHSPNDAAGVALPAENDSYDVVTANSVFTHMLPVEISHYLDECTRILVPGGRLFCTFFLHPTHPSALGPTVRSARYTFDHQREGYRVQHADCDEHVVSYREQDVRDMLRRAGIRLRDIRWGSWRGNAEHLDFQDIVVGVKP